MRQENLPLYMIGVAAQLCGVHPQTLRQYERLGLVIPSRVGSKNRLYSELDIQQVRRIQRLTQEMGVNLAGVELILRLLEDMDEMARDFEQKFAEFASEAERRLAEAMGTPSIPVRKGESLFPVPNIRIKKIDL